MNKLNKTFKINPLYESDGYKVGHPMMIAEGTDYEYWTWIPRNLKYMPQGIDKIMSSHQQMVWRYIHSNFQELFFDQPIDAAHQFTRDMSKYLMIPYNFQGFAQLHELGYLPVRIKALPEGVFTNKNIPHMTGINTVKGYAWLGLFLETMVSKLAWQGPTSATIGSKFKRNAVEWVKKTDENNLWLTDFMCHDFHSRGGNPFTSIAVGLGHAMSNKGSDTLNVIPASRYYYDFPEDEVPIFSVNASEHSVTCTGIFKYERQLKSGKLNHEIEWYYSFKDLPSSGSVENPDYLAIAECLNLRDWLKKFPTGILSVVSDTMDLWKVITHILPRLKPEILGRDGKLVTRPDCYSEDTLILTPDGWKEFGQLTSDSLVAQVNDDGSYSFIKPLKIVNEEYNGPMFHYKDFHGKMDLFVTPNHRMIYRQFDNWKVDYADKFKTNNHTKSFIRSASATNKNKKLSFIERLNIAFQADGSYVTGVKSSIRFSFSKTRKIERLENLLQENNIEYTTYNLGDGKTEFNIKVDKDKVSKNFNWVNIDDLCSNWCREFIEELSHWDSCVRSKGRIKFDTTNESVIKIIEFVALSAGYGCLLSEYEDDRSEIFSKMFTANILLDNRIGSQAIQIEKTNYIGNVVCVTVPTGKIVVKRNRCTMVCGNSGNPEDIICGLDYQEVDDKGEYDGDFKLVKFEGKFYQPEWVAYNSDDGEWVFNKLKTQPSESEQKGVIELLDDVFGSTVNEQGYKILDPHIGAIYGDSINLERQVAIYSRLFGKGYAATNIVIGVGSFSYVMLTRDSAGYAAKGAWFECEGEGYNIYKDPITDDGTKKSLKGFQQVFKDSNGEFQVKGECSKEEEQCGLLQIIYEDGKFFNQTTLDEIRERVNSVV